MYGLMKYFLAWKICNRYANAPVNKRENSLFKDTHVVSGTVKAIVVHIGDDTELGKVAQRLENKAPETDFERGVRKFGYFLV